MRYDSTTYDALLQYYLRCIIIVLLTMHYYSTTYDALL